MPNRLQHSLSPYLLQHAHNPVDWHPWGPEAHDRARAEDKPIFLSIGYSACHWCHVMERESFEDAEVAGELNVHFVPVKVDREERPDLDEIYMEAVQALTGRGGWPMSVWLTPDLKPFYGGTYFPRENGRGMPGFLPLLRRIAELWRSQRDELEAQAAELLQEVGRQGRLEPGRAMAGPAFFEAALGDLRRSFDARWGGFGGAPKFPQHMAVELILRRGTAADQAMALRTLDAMGEGGMYDHLGGGFARYSVDDRWLVPHFEKMLYDNALLARGYLLAFQATGDARHAAIARGTLDYLLRDLRDGAGGFHSSEDADSEGVEGKFYVFTPAEIESVLGAADGGRFCAAYGVTAEGNFEHGTSVLHRFSAPTTDEAGEAGLEPLRRRLLAFRDRRVRPGKDDKVLAGWNGLALSAFALAHRVLGDRAYLDAAEACAGFLRRELWRDGMLLRVWRRGQAQIPAFLEDHAALANGLVDLYEAGFDPAWLRWAEAIIDAMRAGFEDRRDGGFFATREGQADIVVRPKPGFDNAIPSGNTLAAQALLRLGAHLGREDLVRSAEATLACFAPWMARAPRAFLAMGSVLDLALGDPLEIVVAGALEDPATQRLLAVARQAFLPNAVVSAGLEHGLPLHRDRGPVEGKPAAYVCRNRACAAPVASPEALTALLS